MKEWNVIVNIGKRNVEYFLTGGLFLRNGFLTERGANRVATRKQHQMTEDCNFYIQRPDKTTYPLGQKPNR
jgi:hypothetical protein